MYPVAVYESPKEKLRGGFGCQGRWFVFVGDRGSRSQVFSGGPIEGVGLIDIVARRDLGAFIGGRHG